MQLQVQRSRSPGALMLVGGLHLLEHWSYPEAVHSPIHGTCVIIGHGGDGIQEDYWLAGTVRGHFGILALRYPFVSG